MFASGEDLVFLAKDTLQEVNRVPHFTNVSFDEQGRIRGVDEEGHLVIYELNAQAYIQQLERQRVARATEGIDVRAIFAPEVAAPEAQREIPTEGFEQFETTKARFELAFSDIVAVATNLDITRQLRQCFNACP